MYYPLSTDVFCKFFGSVSLTHDYFFQMELPLMQDLLKYLNVHDSRFCLAVIAIIFNPLFWNVVSRDSPIDWLVIRIG